MMDKMRKLWKMLDEQRGIFARLACYWRGHEYETVEVCYHSGDAPDTWRLCPLCGERELVRCGQMGIDLVPKGTR